MSLREQDTPSIHVECDEGWAPLYEPIIAYAAKVGIQIDQIKEKFGGLNIYYHGPEVVAFTLAVDLAQTASLRICEICGEPGKRRQGHWVKTLCSACNQKREEAKRQ